MLSCVEPICVDLDTQTSGRRGPPTQCVATVYNDSRKISNCRLSASDNAL